MTKITNAVTDSTTGLFFVEGYVNEDDGSKVLKFEEPGYLWVTCIINSNSDIELRRTFENIRDDEDLGTLITNYGGFNVLSCS